MIIIQLELDELKTKILELLKKDEEFRYAIAGLIGMEEILRRLDSNEKELVKLWEEIKKLREDMIMGFTRHDEELKKLREDMNAGFSYMGRRLDALGARWGLMSEGAFREGIRALIEREFGWKVERGGLGLIVRA